MFYFLCIHWLTWDWTLNPSEWDRHPDQLSYLVRAHSIFIICFGGSVYPPTQHLFENRKKNCFIYSFALVACVCVVAFCFLFVFVSPFKDVALNKGLYFLGQILFVLRKMLSTFSWLEGLSNWWSSFVSLSLIVSNSRFQCCICMMFEKLATLELQ